MELVKISNCINSEPRLYGLKSFALVFGLIFMVAIWVYTSIIFGMIAALLGYILGDAFSKKWHMGYIQRYIYWHICPIFGNLPKSQYRFFL